MPIVHVVISNPDYAEWIRNITESLNKMYEHVDLKFTQEDVFCAMVDESKANLSSFMNSAYYAKMAQVKSGLVKKRGPKKGSKRNERNVTD